MKGVRGRWMDGCGDGGLEGLMPSGLGKEMDRYKYTTIHIIPSYDRFIDILPLSELSECLCRKKGNK